MASRITTVMTLIACVALAGCANGVARKTSETTVSVDRIHTGTTYDLSSINTHPDILAAEARRDATAEEIVKARAISLPTATFEAEGGGSVGHSDDYTDGGTGGDYSYALSVGIPLYQGGRGRAALAAAGAEYRASTEAANDRRISTAFELANALLEVKLQKGAIAIMDRQESILSRLKTGVEEEMQAGAASRVDVDDIGRQLARLAVDRERARLAASEAGRTAIRLGVSPDTPLPEVSKLHLPDEEYDLIELALHNNPRLKERLARAEAANARIDEAKGSLLPSVSAALGLQGEQDTLLNVSESVALRAQVRLSIPLYSGGALSAAVRQRQDESRAASYEQDSAALGISAAVRSAITRRAQAKRMLVLAEREKRNAASSLEGVRAERKVGERSTFDEIRAIADLTNSELNLNTARYELVAAEYLLAAETGRIDSLFGIASLQQTE